MISVATVAARSSSRLRTSASIRQRSGMTLIALPPSIDPDVGGRLGVQAAEAHGRDGVGGGDDRAAPRLRAHPGVGGAAAQFGDDPVVGGRRDDDLADRGGVVEHVAERALQPRGVELARAAQRDLLAHGEQDLDADRRRLAAAVTRRASSRMTATADLLSAPRMPSLAFSQRPSTSTGSTAAASGTVSRWAHRSRLPEPRPGIRASRLPASEPAAGPLSSSSTSSPRAAQLLGEPVGDGALAPRRALDAAQRRERLVQALALGARWRASRGVIGGGVRAPINTEVPSSSPDSA